MTAIFTKTRKFPTTDAINNKGPRFCMGCMSLFLMMMVIIAKQNRRRPAVESANMVYENLYVYTSPNVCDSEDI